MALPASASQTAWSTGQPEARARLIGGAAPVEAAAFGAPAGSAMAAVEIELAKGWKTYWRFPGDAGGVPPVFNWSKSTNIKSARVLFPAPQRISDRAGDLLGYSGSVTMPVVIEATDPAKPVTLNVTMEYGVCREICIPVETEFSLALAAGGDGALPATVAAALDQVPRPASTLRTSDPKLKRITVTLDGGKPVLTIEAEFPGIAPGSVPGNAANADVYVESPDGYYIPLAKRGSARDIGNNILRFDIDLTGAVEPSQIRGKTALVTLVSEAGRSEANFTFD
ncbi:MAG: protein-disulfide reductase DsbD family protein [Hyphomicrobium aestuarii]|nr:protein-disulfide reductase DsbD family protein [Hyphomicrobium aestuarii]